MLFDEFHSLPCCAKSNDGVVVELLEDWKSGDSGLGGGLTLAPVLLLPWSASFLDAAEKGEDGNEFRNPFSVVLVDDDDAFEKTHLLWNDVEVAVLEVAIPDEPNPLKMEGEFLGGVKVAGRKMGEFLVPAGGSCIASEFPKPFILDGVVNRYGCKILLETLPACWLFELSLSDTPLKLSLLNLKLFSLVEATLSGVLFCCVLWEEKVAVGAVKVGTEKTEPPNLGGAKPGEFPGKFKLLLLLVTTA